MTWFVTVRNGIMEGLSGQKKRQGARKNIEEWDGRS